MYSQWRYLPRRNSLREQLVDYDGRSPSDAEGMEAKSSDKDKYNKSPLRADVGVDKSRCRLCQWISKLLVCRDMCHYHCVLEMEM